MSFGLSTGQIKTVVEDALRHVENPTNEFVAEAIATAIAANNEQLRKDLVKVTTEEMEKAFRRSGFSLK